MRLLAWRRQEPDADANLWDRNRQTSRTRRVPEADRGGREARPPACRARNGPVSLPGRSARFGVLARERVDALSDTRKLYPSHPDRGWLCRGQLTAADGQDAVGDNRAHTDLFGHDFSDAKARGRRARLCRQADELPGARANIQERPAQLSRVAGEDRGIRQGAPL